MKTYKTWEMIKELTENPSKRFRDGLGDIVTTSKKTQRIVWEISEDIPRESDFIMFNYAKNYDNLHIEWEEVPESVDFMTAVNSGKQIKHEEWEHYYELSVVLDLLIGTGNTNIADKINGKWLIKC